MGGLRVGLLGALTVSKGGVPVAVPGTRLRGLIARLALAGGRPVDPSVLVDALWPEDRPGDPANALQSLVSRLRRLLGDAGDVVQVEGGYRLDVTADDVDALRFERLVAEGRNQNRRKNPAKAAEMLAEARDLWHEPTIIAAVAPAVATRLTTDAGEATADLAEAELALNRPEAAATRLTALLTEQPTHERAAGLLLDALAAQGRQAEALAVYERVRTDLADRLGVDPGAALRERHLNLLKTPAIETNEAKTNLPTPLTSFIGRESDIARIDALLAAGRLVTVLGPGGAGKTRLALEATRRRRHEFRDGTWLVDLSSVTEPAKVAAAVVAAVGLRGAALFDQRLPGEAGEIDVLTEQLKGREALLLVDNCEHLIDAVAHLTEALLVRVPGLRVLTTSREPLAVDGEALVPLGPLPLPELTDDIDQARKTAAVRLFTARAAAVRPGFDVEPETVDEIVRVVRGLDGLPLALELAAARLRTLSLAELAAGLSDRFRLLTTGSRTALPRHRTLRAVIAWSWDLLGAHERTVAERVSVLPGGVTIGSATAVCAGTEVPPAEIPELLAALVDRSLLQLAPDSGRYRMLETLREYGIDRLADQQTLDPVRGLAARHLAEVAAVHDPLLRGPDQLRALRVIKAEYDNALAALRQFCDEGDAYRALDLALNLSWYWQMFGRHSDATYWLNEALAVPGSAGTISRDCAEAVRLLNMIGAEQGNLERTIQGHREDLRAMAGRLSEQREMTGLVGAVSALIYFFIEEPEQATAVIDRLIAGDDPWMGALGRMFRAQFAENEGDLDVVRVDTAAAIEAFREVGDRWGLATALPVRALVRQYDADLDGARDDLLEARRLAAEFGSLSPTDEIFIQLRWVDLHMRRGEVDEAIRALGEARERALRFAAPEMKTLVGALEAGIWVQLGDYDRAEELAVIAEQAMATEFPFGGDHGQALVSTLRASLFMARGDLAGAAEPLRRAHEAAVGSHDMPLVAMVTIRIAELAARLGLQREVAYLLGAASRLRGTHDRSELKVRELSREGRAALGEEAFATAYGMGWDLDSKAALLAIDPARLGQGALPAPDSAP